MNSVKNVLSVDVEDFFQVEAFTSVVSYDQWDSFTPRVERNVLRILEIFGNRGAVGTFFVLGWVAEKFPKLVREIAAAGHEIGSHGYRHQRLMILTPEEFRRDLRKSTALLSDQVQKSIRCYRAPSFSVVKSTFWALDILAEEGFDCDSSIFPIRHDLYGVPDGERFPHWKVTPAGGRIFEFPPSTIRLGNRNWGVGGGGYLRLLPYGLTHRAIRHLNAVEEQPAMVYFHPWEIDPEQPRLQAGWRSRIRHYTNLSTTEKKIGALLRSFKFTTLSDVCEQYQARVARHPAGGESYPERAPAIGSPVGMD
jgi:polysaccharide deacetylase family protein (PEP-CTERM system associated)